MSDDPLMIEARQMAIDAAQALQMLPTLQGAERAAALAKLKEFGAYLEALTAELNAVAAELDGEAED